MELKEAEDGIVKNETRFAEVGIRLHIDDHCVPMHQIDAPASSEASFLRMTDAWVGVKDV